MRYLSIIIATFFILGCQEVKKIEAPKNLISKEKMADILTDVYISNAARSINNKVIKEYKIKLDSLVYKKYHIDSLQFVESNAYYSSNIKVYTQIITTVEKRLAILKIEKDSIYQQIKKEKEDSVSVKVNKEKGLLDSPISSDAN